MSYASPSRVVLKGLVFEETFDVFLDATFEFGNVEFVVNIVAKRIEKFL